MPPNTRPSQMPADPLARLGLTADELGLRYADEIALCAKFAGDSATELAGHEATDDE